MFGGLVFTTWHALTHALTGSLSATAACLILFAVGGRQAHLKIWAWGWAALAARHGLLYWGGLSAGTAVADGLLLSAAATFLHGMMVYTGKLEKGVGYRIYYLVPLLFLLAFLSPGYRVLLGITAAFLYFVGGALAVSYPRGTLGTWIIGAAGFFSAAELFLDLGTGRLGVDSSTELLSILFIVGVAVANTQDLSRRQAENLEGVILALAAAVELRDVYTVSHSRHVGALARSIARRMGLPPREVERIYNAGLLHDIGKIGVPDYILQKPGALEPFEFERVKLHPQMGSQILHAAGEGLLPIVPLVRHHHERWDGTGYPEGLQGEEIPLGAAILAVADAYDAVCSNRAYRDARSREKAMKEIAQGAGTQFHPEVVKVFVRDYREITEEVSKDVPGLGGLFPAAAALGGLNPVIGDALQPFDYRVRYRSLLDGANDIIFIFSQDWKVIEWNRKAEETYGYSPEEFQGMDTSVIRSPRARSNMAEQLLKVKEKGEMVYTTEHQRKDGSTFPVEISARTFIQNGRTCWMTIIRDISQRRKWEEEIRQREKWHRQLFQSVSDAVIVHDLDLNILEVNEAACKRLGYTREELLSMRIPDIDTAEAGKQAPNRLKIIERRGQLFFESENKTKDGTVIPVEVNALLIDFSGKPAVLSVLRDLRPRWELGSWTQRVLEAVPYPAYLITSNRTIVCRNRASEGHGGEPGSKCYRSLRGRSEVCPDCLAERALEKMELQEGRSEIDGVAYELIWLPLDHDYYLCILVQERRGREAPDRLMDS